MKLHLFVEKKPINGYVNVSPLGGPDVIVSRLDSLEGIVEAAECTEILAEDILDFFPANNMLELLKYYVSKLRHGGKLIIGGSDLQSVVKSVVTKRLNAIEANQVLFGKQDNTWAYTSGMISLDDLTDLLRNLGLKIVKKRLDGLKMVVEGVRP